MSNFKGWTTENFAGLERTMMAKRIDKKRMITQNCPECRGLGNDEYGVHCWNCSGTGEAKGQRVIIPTKDLVNTTFIGVDPALRSGGFWVCIICRVDNTATFKNCKHLGEFVRILQDANPAAVIVENSNLQKNIFNQKSGVGGAIDVGKNMGVSQSAADIADQYSQIPSGISPKQKGAKVTNDVIFQGIVRSNGLTLTGYKGAIKAAQDQRDALMLALIAEQKYKMFKRTSK